MIHRIFAIIMTVIVITSQLTPVYAAERFQGDMIDWLFEMARRNNTVAQIKYVKDKVNQATSGNTDMIDFADGLVNDYFNNAQYNNDSLRDAVSNTLFGLPKETQENITNVYNNYKNTDIILAPSVQAELNINAFNKAVLKKEAVDTTQRKPKSPPVTEVMTPEELAHLIDTNDIYKHKFDEMASVLKGGKSTILTRATAGKYIYFFQYQQYDNAMQTMNGFDHGYIVTDGVMDLLSVLRDKSIFQDYVPTYIFSEGAYAKYHGYWAYNSNKNGGTGAFVTSLYMVRNNGDSSLTNHPDFYTLRYSSSTQSVYGTSTQPIANIYLRKIHILTDYPTVQNYYTIQNTIDNSIQNFYDYTTIENYYNNECIPAENPTNNYYEYTTNEYNEYGGNTHNINLEYTKNIKEYVTNNTYYGGENRQVTYITNVNQIPNYQAPPTPTPAPTPSPVPTPTTSPSPSPKPEPGEEDEQQELDLSPLYSVGETIKTKLPFSIPFDISRMIKNIFGGQRGAPPVIEVEFPKEYFLAEESQKMKIDFGDKTAIDFPMMVSAARTIFFVSFVIIFLKNIKKFFF